jgi:hypothetical protein
MLYNRLRQIIAATSVVSLLAISACASTVPQSSVSKGLDSGITSSNGGAMHNSREGLVTTTTP